MRIRISRTTLALVFLSFTTLLFVATRKNDWIGSSSPDPARHATPERVAAATDADDHLPEHGLEPAAPRPPPTDRPRRRCPRPAPRRERNPVLRPFSPGP